MAWAAWILVRMARRRVGQSATTCAAKSSLGWLQPPVYIIFQLLVRGLGFWTPLHDPVERFLRVIRIEKSSERIHDRYPLHIHKSGKRGGGSCFPNEEIWSTIIGGSLGSLA